MTGCTDRDARSLAGFPLMCFQAISEDAKQFFGFDGLESITKIATEYQHPNPKKRSAPLPGFDPDCCPAALKISGIEIDSVEGILTNENLRTHWSITAESLPERTQRRANQIERGLCRWIMEKTSGITTRGRKGGKWKAGCETYPTPNNSPSGQKCPPSGKKKLSLPICPQDRQKTFFFFVEWAKLLSSIQSVVHR